VLDPVLEKSGQFLEILLQVHPVAEARAAAVEGRKIPFYPGQINTSSGFQAAIPL
jgi:hypothetical protein